MSRASCVTATTATSNSVRPVVTPAISRHHDKRSRGPAPFQVDMGSDRILHFINAVMAQLEHPGLDGCDNIPGALLIFAGIGIVGPAAEFGQIDPIVLQLDGIQRLS